MNGFPSVPVFLIRDVNINSPPGPKVIRNRYSKLRKTKEHSLVLVAEILLNWISFYKMYLCGHIFKSSLVDRRIKSVMTLLMASGGSGGGSSSKVQNLFLANPCWSRAPRFENCIKVASLYVVKWWKCKAEQKRTKMITYLWEADRNTPTNRLWRLEDRLQKVYICIWIRNKTH